MLLPLICYALFAGERLLPLPGGAPPRIDAEARQWAWTFRYPEQGGVTTKNVLHLPAGKPVDMVVTSRDVIHAFWVPRLAGKIDAVPGRTNRLRIQVDAPGRYEGLCNEFCGSGHADMRFVGFRSRAGAGGRIAGGGQAMSAPAEQPPQASTALRLHRQLAAIWATGPGPQRLAAVKVGNDRRRSRTMTTSSL